MNPNTTTATAATGTRKRDRGKTKDNQSLFFSWKLSPENVTDGSNEDARKKRRLEGDDGDADEGGGGAVVFEELIEEARRLAPTEEHNAPEEETFLPLSQMFELHPLGIGLGEKLHKLKGEQILEPVRLMSRLEPNLTKYERRIQEKREKERRRERLLAQLVALHDQSKDLQEERQRQRFRSKGQAKSEEADDSALVSSSGSRGTLVHVGRHDPHLLHWSITRHMLEEFQHNAWAFSPLHPSAVYEDNVRLVLYGPSNWEAEASALSLNVHTALALGSLITGNEERARHYFQLARAEVGNMFDTSDYNVAEALVGMRYFAFALGDVDQACYFMTMAMSICRQLGAYSSDVYTRCLADLYFLPSTSPLERKRWLSEYCKYATGPSAFDNTRIYSIVYSNEDGDRDRSDGVEAAEKGQRARGNTYHASLVKKSNYNNFSSIEVVLHLFVRALIALDRSGAGMRGKALDEVGQVMSDIRHPDSVQQEMAARVLEGSLSYPMCMAGGLGMPGGHGGTHAKPSEPPSHNAETALGFLNTQFAALETSILKDTLPASFTLTTLLCCASMRAEVYWGMGDTIKALECAKKYTNICKQVERRVRYISSTHLPYGNKILHVLLYLDELDLLAVQLDLFRPLFELYPSWRETRDYYQLKLLERRKQQEQQPATRRRSIIQDDEMLRLKREVEQWHHTLNDPRKESTAVHERLQPQASAPMLRGDVAPVAFSSTATSSYCSAAAARFPDAPSRWPQVPPKRPHNSSPALASEPSHFLPASAPSFVSPYAMPTVGPPDTTTTTTITTALSSSSAPMPYDLGNASSLQQPPYLPSSAYQPPPQDPLYHLPRQAHRHPLPQPQQQPPPPPQPYYYSTQVEQPLQRSLPVHAHPSSSSSLPSSSSSESPLLDRINYSPSFDAELESLLRGAESLNHAAGPYPGVGGRRSLDPGDTA